MTDMSYGVDSYGPGHVGSRVGVADDVGGGDVEQQRAERAGAVALGGLGAQRGEGAAAGDLVELDQVGRPRVGGAREHQRRRHHPAAGRVTRTRRRSTGRGSGCPRPPGAASRAGHRGAEATVAAVALGPHVEDLDEVGGVAPGGEALGRDVAGSLARHGVHELEPHPLVVEGDVLGQVALAGPPVPAAAVSAPLDDVALAGTRAPVPRPAASTRMAALESATSTSSAVAVAR